MDDALERAFARHYPTPGHSTLRERGLALCSEYLKSGLADANARQKLCSEGQNSYWKFWQQVSEIIVAQQLIDLGLQPIHRKMGPDFLIEHAEGKIWIEVVCPEPHGIPANWLMREIGQAYSLPHEQMLLRWTAAIKEKAEKLIGAENGAVKVYIKAGVVDKQDIYVIAVNGRLLRNSFPCVDGVSQFPFAVEAALCVGPYAITFDSEMINKLEEGTRIVR